MKITPGSSSLIQSFTKADLIDEFVLRRRTEPHLGDSLLHLFQLTQVHVIAEALQYRTSVYQL